SLKELEERLRAVAAGRQPIDDCYIGDTKAGRNQPSRAEAPQTVGAWLDGRNDAALCEHWVAGGAVNWRRLYGTRVPRRISLPTYPFERERFWVPVPETGVAARTSDRGALDRAADIEAICDDVMRGRVTIAEAAEKIVA